LPSPVRGRNEKNTTSVLLKEERCGSFPKGLFGGGGDRKEKCRLEYDISAGEKKLAAISSGGE